MSMSPLWNKSYLLNALRCRSAALLEVLPQRLIAKAQSHGEIMLEEAWLLNEQGHDDVRLRKGTTVMKYDSSKCDVWAIGSECTHSLAGNAIYYFR